ncbi:MAG: hypothetical protein JWM59_3122 [Verrucomicrobiales bacterium]|nr:hypothetical protein [Verrucomicrobiales bacterium]
MNEKPAEDNELSVELQERRRFLQSMGKWSGAAIGAAVAGAWLASAPEARAGAWVNRRTGGGTWVNRAGGWINGGGGWINGGGGAWVNRRAGGGSWVNRR